MIKRENYEILRKKYGDVASWAIWGQPVGSVKSGMGDMSVFDDCNLLDKLNPDVVFVGLNASGRHEEYLQEEKPWHNFHSGAPSSQSYKLRWAIAGTPLWGAYITDIIKDYKEVDSREVKKHLNRYPSLVKENISRFQEELALLSTNPLLIALGRESYDILRQHLGTEYRIERITHYSMMFSYQEVYPCEIEAILRKYNLQSNTPITPPTVNISEQNGAGKVKKDLRPTYVRPSYIAGYEEAKIVLQKELDLPKITVKAKSPAKEGKGTCKDLIICYEGKRVASVYVGQDKYRMSLEDALYIYSEKPESYVIRSGRKRRDCETLGEVLNEIESTMTKAFRIEF